MKVGSSVRLSIVDWERGEMDSAMLHACNAVDGTAREVFPRLGNKQRFTRFLRDNYAILGPMGAPGINIAETRFPVPVPHPTAPGGEPDIADVLYGIHRCCHAHGEELPQGFELLPDASGPSRLTRMDIERGKVRLSDRIIFGLVAVAVLSPVNRDQRIADSFFLTFGSSAKLIIDEWWGRASDFPAIVAADPMPSVKLDFTDWMSAAQESSPGG